ncbi:hypothetical protein BTO06_11690 [Tenacibaculum sp. SZ-18]|uniref:hypothetical protein n=1 Tax=Tenacibaculum sp. SZ-18 TaxID=754423 RepID=UPI000C2D55F8|nr:hypothetical protein [Tenacibaculum sp. SZ-18]AUC15770.1 hypothetical protein BTO06_11690 [Tenacibaculum sp. SZ-18]
MTTLIIFFLILIGLNCIPYLTKKEFPRFKNIITRGLTISLIIISVIVIFLYNGYRLEGIYSNSFLELTFIIFVLLFFSIVKNNRTKLLKLLVLIPSVCLIILLFIFEQVIAEYEINETYRIEVSESGFLNCGERISITKSELGIFRKRIFTRTDLCLIGINKIETIEFNENDAEFLIYHNGNYDSENPFKYRITNKNVW